MEPAFILVNMLLKQSQIVEVPFFTKKRNFFLFLFFIVLFFSRQYSRIGCQDNFATLPSECSGPSFFSVATWVDVALTKEDCVTIAPGFFSFFFFSFSLFIFFFFRQRGLSAL